MITLIVISLLFLCEAWLEVVVIDLKDGNHNSYSKLNRQEHFRSAVFACMLIVCGCVTAFFWEQDPWSLPAIVASRRIWFDFPLALFRNRNPRLYEGYDWWADLFRKIFGQRGRVRELVATIAVTLFCIIKSVL